MSVWLPKTKLLMKKLLLFFFLLSCYQVEKVQAQLFGGQLKTTISPYPPGTVHCNPAQAGTDRVRRHCGDDALGVGGTVPGGYGD